MNNSKTLCRANQSRRQFFLLAPLLCCWTLGAAPALAERKPYAITAAKLRAQEARTKIPSEGPRFATVLESSFEKVSAKDGLWRGAIKGNGEIKLSLLILRNGIVESSRYMGHVFLNSRKRPIKFVYKSPTPLGRDWSWRVDAAAF